MDLAALVHFVLWMIVVGMVLGLLYMIVQKAPFIPDPWKPFMLWAIFAMAALFLILEVLLPMVSGPSSFRLR